MKYNGGMNKNKFAALAVAAIALQGFGVTIAIDRVQQRYPWNGLVDVDYTIAGLDNAADPNDYHVSLTVTAVTNGVTAVFAASNFTNFAASDLPASNGRHRATWNPAADGLVAFTRDVKVKARLDYDPVTDGEADYVIVDVSAGPAATEYPVRYVKGAAIRVETFNIDRYRTDCIVLKRVKAGTFKLLGTCWVELTKDYYLGIFPVTMQQYLNVIGGTNPSYGANDVGGSWKGKPVNFVSWNNVMGEDKFVDRLLAKAKCRAQAVEGFSLPTEAQWEYAARAGTTTAYYWGDSPSPDYAWYGKDRPDTVGNRLPNGWGFYDVIGNVPEWCLDCYDSKFIAGGTEDAPLVDPVCEEGTTKVVRSTYYGATINASQHPVSARKSIDPNTGRTPGDGWVYGFRLVKNLQVW